MNVAFELTEVSKSFGSVNAIEELSLSVLEGSVVGLIGRNGCGKTTLLRHVVGLYLPTEGDCETLGCPAAKLGQDELSQIGIVHQESRFLVWMSVKQHLRYVASSASSPSTKTSLTSKDWTPSEIRCPSGVPSRLKVWARKSWVPTR